MPEQTRVSRPILRARREKATDRTGAREAGDVDGSGGEEEISLDYSSMDARYAPMMPPPGLVPPAATVKTYAEMFDHKYDLGDLSEDE